MDWLYPPDNVGMNGKLWLNSQSKENSSSHIEGAIGIAVNDAVDEGWFHATCLGELLLVPSTSVHLLKHDFRQVQAQLHTDAGGVPASDLGNFL